MPQIEQGDGIQDEHHSVYPIRHSMEAKLGIARPCTETINRSGLISTLVKARHTPFVLIAAPAGYGKSALLGQWYAHQRTSSADADPGAHRPFAAVTVDSTDNNPVSFWAAVVHAATRACPEIDTRLIELLRTPRPDIESAVLPGLLAEISQKCPHLILALDDYQEITEPECHDQVNYLLNHLPPQACLALATRTDPPLSLGRLRASGAVLEIRTDELRFARPEAAQVVWRISGHQLTERDLDELMQRTEGWPAGVSLAARLLRNQPDPAAFLNCFAGNNRHVVDYFDEEVLRHLPGEVQRFLARTAILDHFTARLCDAVAGTANSADLLDGLERSNLFLVRLDGVRTWYRYHPLFGQTLREQLTRTDPGAAARLHRKAGAWFEQSGDPGRAIEHLLAAGDADAVRGLIARHWAHFVYQGHAATVRAWLSVLGTDGTARSPLTAICAAWVSALAGEHLASQRWLKTAEQLDHQGPLPDGMVSVRAAVALYQATFGFGGFPEMLAAARTATDLHGDPRIPWYAQARVALGFSHYLAGDAQSALGPLQQAAQAAGAFPVLRVQALSTLSLVTGGLGRTAQAADLADAAQELVQTQELADSSELTLARVARAAVLLREGRLLQARQELQRAVRVRRALIGLPLWPTVTALVLLARVTLALGERDETRALLDEITDLLDLRPDGAEQVRATLAEIARRLASAEHPLAVIPRLTDRERTVLRLLPGGLPLREVAAQLFVTVNTVKSHTRLIYRKLGVSSRPEAIRRARQLGLL